MPRFLSVFLAFGGLTPGFLKPSTVVNTPAIRMHPGATVRGSRAGAELFVGAVMDPRGTIATIAKRRKYGRFLPRTSASMWINQVPLPFVNDIL